jgi:hypothetical protein
MIPKNLFIDNLEWTISAALFPKAAPKHSAATPLSGSTGAAGSISSPTTFFMFPRYVMFAPS